MKKCVLLISILFSLLSINAASLSVQEKLGFSDGITIDGNTQGTLLTTFSKNDESHTFGVRVSDTAISLLFSSDLQAISSNQQQWQLKNSIPVLIDSNSIFMNVRGGFKRQLQNSNHYTISFLIGAEGSTSGDNYLSFRFAGGLNMNASKIDGIETIFYTFIPAVDFTIGFKMGDFLSNISIMTNTLYYTPAEPTLCFSTALVYMANENVSFCFDGTFILADLPAETKFITRYEANLFFTWRFDV